MVLSGLVLLVWQVFFAPKPGELVPATTPERRVEKVEVTPEPRPDQPPVVDRQPDERETPPSARQIAVRTDTLVTPHFKVELTNRDAAVQSVHIIDPEQYSRRGDLLNAFPEDSPYRPFSIAFLDSTVLSVPQGTVFELIDTESVRSGNGYSRITYRYQDPRNRYDIDKIFSIDAEQPFVINMDVRINNRHVDTLGARLAVDVFGTPDPSVERNFLDFRPDELEGVCRLLDDTERYLFQKVEDKTQLFTAQTIWGAIDTRYFLLANVPADRAARCEISRVDSMYMRTRVTSESFTVAPSMTLTQSHLLYMGPKDYGVLSDIGHRLEESVDYGLLTVLARPLRWLLVLFNGWVGNWGLAIILLTLLIKIVTWPITDKAYVNAERMKLIQPKLQEVKKKYENDQQRMTEETMKLFKEHNVSALGCLPMLIQMPVLYGLFVMIYNSVELYQAHFALWYVDLSAPDPYFVLPILMGAIMVIQQRMTTIDTGNAQMAMMMKIMPIVFTAFMLFLPSGLVLYYFVNLVLGLGQQVWIKRKFARAAQAGAAI